MNFFVLLNRAMKGLIVALWCGAVWMLWQQREHARPLVDLLVVWEDAGSHSPPLLSRSPGTVIRVLGENVVQFRDVEGVTWNVGLDGLGGVLVDGRDARSRQFASETRTNLNELLVNQPVQIAWSATHPNRTAMGFVYLGTNSESLALDLVANGRLRWLPESTRVLPLWEQARLRGADRLARSQRRGLWQFDLASPTP